MRVLPDILPIFPRFFTTLRFLTIAIFTAFVKEEFIRILSKCMMNDEVLLLHHLISAAAGTALLPLKKRKIEEAQKEKAKKKMGIWVVLFL